MREWARSTFIAMQLMSYFFHRQWQACEPVCHWSLWKRNRNRKRGREKVGHTHTHTHFIQSTLPSLPWTPLKSLLNWRGSLCPEVSWIKTGAKNQIASHFAFANEKHYFGDILIYPLSLSFSLVVREAINCRAQIHQWRGKVRGRKSILVIYTEESALYCDISHTPAHRNRFQSANCNVFNCISNTCICHTLQLLFIFICNRRRRERETTRNHNWSCNCRYVKYSSDLQCMAKVNEWVK